MAARSNHPLQSATRSAIAFAKRCLTAAGLEIRRIRPDATGRPRRTNFNEQTIFSVLAARLPISNRLCVDIGAGDGITHSNSLDLFEQGFAGAACEGHGERFAKLAYLHRHREKIRLSRLFITPDNVVPWLQACDLPRDFAILSLDIDGYDHFVLERILSAYQPAIVCLEINEKIPPPLHFTVLWQPDWAWDGGHCFGQSLALAHHLAAAHGYQLVALEYNNAFFVRRDLAASELNPEAATGVNSQHPNPARNFEVTVPLVLPMPLPDLTPEQAYRQGYLDRPDRLQRLPWNRDMEELHALSPEQAIAFIHHRFAAYVGKYRLEIGD